MIAETKSKDAKQITIQYDGTFDIAIGKSRTETNWKNKQWLWSDLVRKLSQTHRTAETLSEYMAAKKPRQDEIKDIGGFVGGYLSGGKRSKYSVLHRQLITFDIDHGNGGAWDDFTLLYDNAACVYSTHKHSPEAPRLRLVLPLDREVTVDEYEAISRRIAGHLGINDFDDTTFEHYRLMYWPSTSKDGEYVFDWQDGPWLSADNTLATYKNWRDTSEWPVSERTNHLVQRAIKKQGDPLEKPGLIGAFCRAYDIHQAIEAFLPDVYEACAVENRYTFTAGSTAAGLIVYDDKYAFSHHGTDPVSGKLCNAFDLVRIHKYGLKDEDANESTPIGKLPSFKAMQDFAIKDPLSNKMAVQEKLESAQSDFSDPLESEADQNERIETLSELLKIDENGKIDGTIDNIVKILENDSRLKGKFAFNEFEQRECILGNLPWDKKAKDAGYFTDADMSHLRHYLEVEFPKMRFARSVLEDALNIVFTKNRFHPIKEYLECLTWDGTERIETLFIDFLGAEDNQYTRTVTRKALTAAVARIYRPGIKFDHMLTLVGAQGIGKGTILQKLAVKEDWYSESFPTVQGKEAMESVQGVWIGEMGELAGMKKADVEAIKHFITSRYDRFRVAYGRRSENFPRQCVLFGTTNKQDFLRDPTGNRRFWPIAADKGKATKDLFGELTPELVGQVWAEAKVLFKNNEPLFLDPDTEAMARDVQSEFSEAVDQIGGIVEFLNTPVPVTWDKMNLGDRRQFLSGSSPFTDEVELKVRDRICVAEVWCEHFRYEQGTMNNNNTKHIHTILQGLEDWMRSKGNLKFGPHGMQKGYIRIKNQETRRVKRETQRNTNGFHTGNTRNTV